MENLNLFVYFVKFMQTFQLLFYRTVLTEKFNYGNHISDNFINIPQKPKTVIVDLDNTLICSSKYNFAHNPTCESFIMKSHAREFLRALKKMDLNVIIYTAATYNYAKCILDELDCYDSIDKVLARNFCTKGGKEFKKHVELFCNTKDYVIVDNKCVYSGKENNSVIKIKPFYISKRFDKELLKVFKHIKNMVTHKQSKFKTIEFHNFLAA